MATKKAPVRASRAAPVRAQSKPKLAALPPAPVPDGMVLLAHHGGATLNFRDGSGSKRRALRGVPFRVDAATAGLLLATDPSVSVSDAEDAQVPLGPPRAEPEMPAVEGQEAPEAPMPEPVAPALPPAVLSSPGPGAITLGDLPAFAKIGGR